eukprot:2273055-Rhodomonas_salina.1
MDREREREMDRERQRERKRTREGERQRETERERQRERETERERERKTEGETERALTWEQERERERGRVRGRGGMGERGRVSERQVVEHANEEESEGCIVGRDAGPWATAIIVGGVCVDITFQPQASSFSIFQLIPSIRFAILLHGQTALSC